MTPIKLLIDDFRHFLDDPVQPQRNAKGYILGPIRARGHGQENRYTSFWKGYPESDEFRIWLLEDQDRVSHSGCWLEG